MGAALVLERVAADGRVSAREWRDLLAPELRQLPARAHPTPRRLLDLMADRSVRMDPSARVGAREMLEHRFGYQLAPAPLSGQRPEAIAQSNVSHVDEDFAELLRRSGSPMRPVTVAVIDLGFNEDPTAAQWTNPEEARGTPEHDDDGNRLRDDVHGWDFKSRESDLRGPHGFFSRHGTHVRARAVAGSALLQALSARAFGMSHDTSTQDIVDAIRYAADNGARVINLSANIQGRERVQAVRALIEEYPHITFVKSAGNDGALLGVAPYDEEGDLAAVRLPNLAVVGAADGDWLAGFSNRSRHHVDLIAQGTRVLGRVGPEAFERMSGTSMAAAAVSNAIAPAPG